MHFEIYKKRVEGTPDGAPKHVLNDLRKYPQEATKKFYSKQNIVNMLEF